MTALVLRVCRRATSRFIAAGWLFALGDAPVCLFAQQQVFETAQMIPALPPTPGDSELATHTPMTMRGEDWQSGPDQRQYFQLKPSDNTLVRLPIFFPPNPPSVDGINSGTWNRRARFSPPPAVADYVSELFYAPLSTCLATDSLSRKLKARLAAYQETRLALENQLQAKLNATRELAPAARWQELESFAREQTPKIAEWEKSADELREDLIARGADWNQTRSWRIGDSGQATRPATALLEVVRAAPFYLKGLSTDQRRLLREVAMELELAMEQSKPEDAEPLMFFSPDMARIRIPRDLPAELSSKLTVYEAHKSALRKELFEVIEKTDRPTLGVSRSGVMRNLARTQAPRFAALETLAHEIRLGFAALPKRDRRPDLPTWPESLAGKAIAHVQKQQELARHHRETMQKITKQFADSQARRDENGVKAAVLLVADLKRDYTRDVALLVQERDALCAEIARAFGDQLTRETKTAGALLDEFIEARRRWEEWDIYRDYRIAVFEPGLSPEQRRLLFQSAMARLNLPLPNGDLQPN